ncbi:MAG: ankyrin repeat domain-containing protein [Clostridia bacterium]|nr:ankyrin repeat domain-containing protein [Clostridia bacterium]
MIRKRRICLHVALSALICICVFLLSFLVVKVKKYNDVSKLCKQIKNGTYTSTTIGNGVSYPIWLIGITSRTFEDAPDIPLVVACQYGNEKAIRDLLENGADPNWSYKGGFSPIEALYTSPFQGKENRLEMAKLLVDYGADVTYCCSGVEAIFEEVSRLWLHFSEQEEITVAENMCFLLDHGASRVDPQSEISLLHYTARDNSLFISEILVKDYQFDVNYQTSTGQTALMFAAEKGNIDIVNMLLSHEADKMLTDANGKTAYDYAVENGYTELAELLKP